jgi:hypothetical protein
MTNISAIINPTNKLNTLQVHYSYQISATDWNGTIRDNFDNVLARYHAPNSQSGLPDTSPFDLALTLWNAYSVMDFI